MFLQFHVVHKLTFYPSPGSIPSELGMMSSLQLLGLHNNTLELEIPSEIWNLTQLSALYLDGNNFRGTIPREVEKLTELVDFRLRCNDMGGTLPASSLTSLSESSFLSDFMHIVCYGWFSCSQF